MARAQAFKHLAEGVMVHAIATCYVLIVNCKLVGFFNCSNEGTNYFLAFPLSVIYRLVSFIFRFCEVFLNFLLCVEKLEIGIIDRNLHLHGCTSDEGLGSFGCLVCGIFNFLTCILEHFAGLFRSGFVFQASLVKQNLCVRTDFDLLNCNFVLGLLRRDHCLL
jgi:hypothetical protein